MNLFPIFVHDRLYIPHQKETVEIIDQIKNKFVYNNPKYYKSKAMGFYVNDNDKYIQNYKFTTYKDMNVLSVPRGGLDKIKQILSKNDLEAQFIDERLSLGPIEGWTNNVTLRPDQERLLEVLKDKENCLIRAPQGSGKTEVGLKFAEHALQTKGNVLVVVWQADLLDEWVERTSLRFQCHPDEIGIIKGAKKKIKPITIAMQQTLKNCIDKYKDQFSCIICDEIQRFAASTFVNVINKFPAYYRIGFSASEKRSDGMEFHIYDMFGKVADEVKKTKLIDKGAIHEIFLRIVPTNYNFFVNGVQYRDIEDIRDKNFTAMLSDMIQDKDRNNVIWDFLEPVLNAGYPSLVMSHRRNHVYFMDDYISKNGYKCGKVLGGTDKEIKAEAIQSIKSAKDGKIQAVVGTIPIKLGQGVNVPRWSRGFLLTPIKNFEQFDQIAGRLSRKFEGKTEAILYVFWDKELYPYQLGHFRKWYRTVSIFDWKTEKFRSL